MGETSTTFIPLCPYKEGTRVTNGLGQRNSHRGLTWFWSWFFDIFSLILDSYIAWQVLQLQLLATTLTNENYHASYGNDYQLYNYTCSIWMWLLVTTSGMFRFRLLRNQSYGWILFKTTSNYFLSLRYLLSKYFSLHFKNLADLVETMKRFREYPAPRTTQNLRSSIGYHHIIEGRNRRIARSSFAFRFKS